MAVRLRKRGSIVADKANVKHDHIKRMKDCVGRREYAEEKIRAGPRPVSAASEV